jgi:hypothetical protein
MLSTTLSFLDRNPWTAISAITPPYLGEVINADSPRLVQLGAKFFFWGKQ